MRQSDKFFWHRYVEFYETELEGHNCGAVLEYGVFKGHSIQWLCDRFPNAKVFGCDIIPAQSEWPKEERIKYFQIDQGSIDQIQDMFKMINMKLDLIIEDGSHHPMHQRNCLIESVRHINSGGVYILEDIHTSHPEHPYFKKIRPFFQNLIGPLHVLLAIEHIQALGDGLTDHLLNKLTRNSLFNKHDIELLYEKIKSITIYKRAKLPYKCFNCGDTDFDYSKLKCKCGVFLYSPFDSMSALIHVH